MTKGGPGALIVQGDAALIIQGDALHLPLPDASVDLVVTSPPYWSLRAYSAGPGEIGSEGTPTEYLEALWAATAEFVRVLKPTGSAFIDLGDKYNSAASGQNGTTGTLRGNGHVGGGPKLAALAETSERGQVVRAMPPKSLMLLPERYRIGCVDRLGLIARAVIVWQKPNGLPESVTDRVRRSHEDWVHLVKQPRYYSATDEIREPHIKQNWENRHSYPPESTSGYTLENGKRVSKGDAGLPLHPLGKLPGSVWSIPSEPLRLPDHLGVQHYAAFPSEWPRRLILGFSPPGICVECGHGRVPVVERERVKSPVHGDGSIIGNRDGGPDERGWDGLPRFNMAATILGYACPCAPFTDHPGSGEPSGPDKRYGDHLANGGGYSNVGAGFGGRGGLGDRPKVGPWREWHLDRWTPPPTRPAVVLDPFAGTGTVPLVARALGRIGIGVDLKHDYARAAHWRVFSSGDWQDVIARTTGRRVKPLPKHHPGQTALDLTGGSLLAEAASYQAEMEMWRDRIATIEGEGGE